MTTETSQIRGSQALAPPEVPNGIGGDAASLNISYPHICTANSQREKDHSEEFCLTPGSRWQRKAQSVNSEH
jgi:hypothetical protein